MDSIGVLMACPMLPYIERELDRRFNLFRFWNYPNNKDFLDQNSASIRTVVGNATVGANVELIEALPKLEIVALNSVGLDKVDLGKCKEKGIRVSNTRGVLTDDVADVAIGLMLMTLRKMVESDKYLRDLGYCCAASAQHNCSRPLLG